MKERNVSNLSAARKEREKKRDRYFLPWLDQKGVPAILLLVLLALVLFSVLFLPYYNRERTMLLARLAGEYVPIQYSSAPLYMKPFWTMAWWALMPIFYYAAACLLGGIPMSYLSCRRISRADYTLKRLGSKWEYHRRCLFLPIAMGLLSLLVFGLLTGLYYALYMYLTPPELLLPAPYHFY